MIESEKMSSTTSTIRDATERFGREGRVQAQEAIHGMEELYEHAGTWLQDNYGKAIALVGVVAVAGAVGYMIGRNSQISSSQIAHHS